jgi:two-component system chemotaxis response regulator CheB
MRNLIGRIIEADPELTLAGKAMNGKFALEKVERLDPDVMVLDLEMPEMNGIEFLKQRKERGIKTPVVILSSHAQKGAEITMEALNWGASDFIMKPSSGPNQDLKKVGELLTQTLKAYGRQHRAECHGEEKTPQVRYETRRPLPTPASAPAPVLSRPEVKGEPKTPPSRKALTGKIEVVALGISTGGPNALREVFAQIDPDLPVPILVVQHMPAGFTKEFASSLNRICPLEVKEAEEGDILKPGRILVARGDRHLVVEKKRLAAICHLSEAPLRSGHRPSADVLFESVAAAFGGNSLAVIMTGMGKDGATEIGQIFREGGITIAQDEPSSVVYGMPRVAYENGFIDHVVPLSQMAETISRIVAENS